MKKLNVLILVAFLAIAVAGTLAAQSQADLDAQRAQIQSDRNAAVAANLPLTDAQTATFWPLYKQYRAEMQKVGDRMLKLITDYANSYNTTLTDEQAAALLKEFLEIQKETLKIKEQYAPRFSAILPAKSVLRFYQIENKLDAMLMKSIAAQVPLAN
jgi:Spy/CpxP family protein refolding chaperone